MKTMRLVLAVLFIAVGILAGPAFAGDRVLFYHNDALGSPVVMTDAAGNVTWRADYEPFGEISVLTDGLQAPNTHQFIGKETDPETSLHYLGARFYDGSTGRFLSVDPILLRGQKTIVRSPQLLNMYVYGANNPYRFLDPTGMDILDSTSSIGVGGETGGGDTGGGTGGGEKTDDPRKDPEKTKILKEIGCAIMNCPQDPYDWWGPLVIPGATGGGKKPTSPNQMDKQVQRGQAPNSVDRVDQARVPNEKPHIEFKDGSALNNDGTWKHGGRGLTNSEKQWIQDNGWQLPK